MTKLPRLPHLLAQKLYKSGQTRGADDSVIYQNRVARNSTVLIPYLLWNQISQPPEGEAEFENGYIALIPPSYYFGTPTITAELASRSLIIGENALVFYQTRAEWIAHNPEARGWTAAHSRSAPMGGQYVARIAATTATDDNAKIIRGFNTTTSKGAGIRLYEYASATVIGACRLQLELSFWFCRDALAVAQSYGMTQNDAETRSTYVVQQCETLGLLDGQRLEAARIINSDGKTICPLCLVELSAHGFFKRVEQAEGREVHDLTITQLNLFHIAELRYGTYNHRTYNVGWGHHHCNIVVKDAGIMETLHWMYKVVDKNITEGYFAPENNSN